MRSIVKAQLARSMAPDLVQPGHDATLFFDFLAKNRISTVKIENIAFEQEQALTTNDMDFAIRYRALLRPYKMLRITPGTISKTHLQMLMMVSLPAIVTGFDTGGCIELNRSHRLSPMTAILTSADFSDSSCNAIALLEQI